MLKEKPELTIGFVGPKDDISNKIIAGLQQHFIKIKEQVTPEQVDERHCHSTDKDLWLISIFESDWTEPIEFLLEHSDIPVYFSEHDSVNDWTQWTRKLARKIRQLIEEEQSNIQTSLDFVSSAKSYQLTQHELVSEEDTFTRFQKKSNQLSDIIVNEVEQLQATLAVLNDENELKSQISEQYPTLNMGMELWVLGSSFGGPEALKLFFDALPDERFPVAFFIVQHIDQGQMQALKAMLEPCLDRLELHLMRKSQYLQSSSVYIVPNNCRLTFVPNGLIAPSNMAWTAPFSPNVNDVIEDCLNNYPAHSGGVIIFSGMSDDGSKNLAKVASRGWKVWAQSESSCIHGSMPNAARATGCVEISANPTELAQAFHQHMQEKYAGQY